MPANQEHRSKFAFETPPSERDPLNLVPQNEPAEPGQDVAEGAENEEEERSKGAVATVGSVRREEEDDGLLEHRNEVAVPSTARSLFLRRSYTHVVRGAEEGQFDDFR